MSDEEAPGDVVIAEVHIRLVLDGADGDRAVALLVEPDGVDLTTVLGMLSFATLYAERHMSTPRRRK